MKFFCGWMSTRSLSSLFCFSRKTVTFVDFVNTEQFGNTNDDALATTNTFVSLFFFCLSLRFSFILLIDTQTQTHTLLCVYGVRSKLNIIKYTNRFDEIIINVLTKSLHIVSACVLWTSVCGGSRREARRIIPFRFISFLFASLSLSPKFEVRMKITKLTKYQKRIEVQKIP